jgi:hypothetical protein
MPVSTRPDSPADRVARRNYIVFTVAVVIAIAVFVAAAVLLLV